VIGPGQDEAGLKARSAPANVQTSALLAYDYGPSHPLRVKRLDLTGQLIKACGLPWPEENIAPASLTQLACFHDPGYLAALEKFSDSGQGDEYYAFAYGLGLNDNPAFPGLWPMARLIAGASLRAMEKVISEGCPAVFVPSGGMHHALPGRASGFCYINDLGIIIRHLLSRGHKVAYVDLDAHHGDGVQWPFYENDRVLTISIHQSPLTLFPDSGLAEETGRGRGLGYAVNIPLWPDSDDDIYITCFEAVVPPLLRAFAPDYIITQLGVDGMWSDPMANLGLTTRAYLHCFRRLKDLAWGRWIATGGGGYNLMNVARCWTLAWAVMLGRENTLPSLLPAGFCARHNLDPEDSFLLDPPGLRHGRHWLRAQEEYKQALTYLKTHLMPRWGF
jgi:acetoin utilization protein AcuC